MDPLAVWRANPVVAAVVGGVLTIVGIAGFFSGPVLLVFGINTLHNLVHIATGLILLAAALASEGAWARGTNLTIGIVYGLVAILGFLEFLTPTLLNSQADAVPFADAWLHAALSAVLIVTALAAGTTAPRKIGRGRMA